MAFIGDVLANRKRTKLLNLAAGFFVDLGTQGGMS